MPEMLIAQVRARITAEALPLRQVAAATGVSYPSVCAWVNGYAHGSPSRTTQRRFAAWIGHQALEPEPPLLHLSQKPAQPLPAIAHCGHWHGISAGVPRCRTCGKVWMLEGVA